MKTETIGNKDAGNAMVLIVWLLNQNDKCKSTLLSINHNTFELCRVKDPTVL